MSGRADPFGEDDRGGQGLDLSSFKPLKRPAKVSPAEVRKVAEKASFQSREPDPLPRLAAPEPSEPRLYRTGRNVQFSVKVTQELHDQIYSLTDELAKRVEAQVPGMRWTVGMTVERMVAALKNELEDITR